MRFFLVIVLLLCTDCLHTTAQVQVSFYLGTGYPYAAASKAHISNSFVLGTHAAVLLHMPVGKRGLGIETGCSYTVKGFMNKDTLRDEHLDGYWAYEIRNHLGYLGFPLMLTYRHDIGKNHTLSAGAGMLYGFVIHGKTHGVFHIYRKGSMQDESEFTLPIEPKLVPAGDGSGSQTYLFDAGLKLQLSYIWRGRWSIRLFHEHSLYSYHAPGSSKSETKLRYTGIALSCGFPRLR